MTTFAPAAPAYRRVTGTPTWRAISRRHRVRLLETLEWISGRLRQKGEHGGPATHATVRVFRALLFRFASAATGVCLPGYKALAKAARTSERTAERAVQRLEALGVLRVHPRHAVWVAPDGTEVRVRTSNGYTFPGATGLDDLLGDLPGVAARVRRLRERMRGWRQKAGVTTPGGPWCANRDPWLRQSLEREYRASFSRLLDDRCPTRPMRRAATRSPGRAIG
jgi:hypothetical protein